MAVSRRSLSEDFADGYNHTWSALLLLSLAVVAWLLPFGPVVSQLTTQSPGPPRYKATCWTPAHFSAAQESYTNKLCAGRLNTAMRQENPGVLGVDLMDTWGQSGSSERPKLYRPLAMRTGQAEQEDVREETYLFVGTVVPVVLFLFAVCLRLPHVCWRVMSSCGSINVDQTLDTASRGSTLDTDSQRQLNSDLCLAAARAARSCRGVALSYLGLKLLLCLVALGQLVVVSCVLLPRLTQLKDRNHNTPNTSLYEDNLLLTCDFSIVHLQNVERYTVQCLYSHSLETRVLGAVTQMTSDPDTPTDVLLGYQALLTAVLAYLVVLLGVNVLRAVTWTSRLVAGTCRSPLTRAAAPSLSLDLSFLLLMSEENSCPLVTQSLARALTTDGSPHDTGLDQL
ncbi:uncharacterized protein LOC106013645 [Aplysia californica]|uniref:Innexin n=1 Tax=Aplysia californica TaxID=6500 RepID=A0ABM1AD15_APLCA|nr:uncharacterized protein LOC106013645 [Aplysia californica]